MAFDAIELDGRALLPVPEPTGVMLLAAGGLALGVRQRLIAWRRRR